MKMSSSCFFINYRLVYLPHSKRICDTRKIGTALERARFDCSNDENKDGREIMVKSIKNRSIKNLRVLFLSSSALKWYNHTFNKRVQSIQIQNNEVRKCHKSKSRNNRLSVLVDELVSSVYVLLTVKPSTFISSRISFSNGINYDSNY